LIGPGVQVDQTQKRWEEWLSVATSLYPVYVLVGGLLAYFRPSTFTWFVERGPTSYSAALCIIMLAMGFTLRIQDLFDVFLNRPLAVSVSIPPLQLRSYLKLAFQLLFKNSPKSYVWIFRL
jgi:predicted Na+-dependent transporter